MPDSDFKGATLERKAIAYTELPGGFHVTVPFLTIPEGVQVPATCIKELQESYESAVQKSQPPAKLLKATVHNDKIVFEVPPYATEFVEKSISQMEQLMQPIINKYLSDITARDSARDENRRKLEDTLKRIREK